MSRRSVNPDIHDTNKITAVAKEINGWLDLDWSMLYGSSPETVQSFRGLIIADFNMMPPHLVKIAAPLFADYMISDCEMDVNKVDWVSIAIAVDNLNGMYHPLRLTKIVLREQDD